MTGNVQTCYTAGWQMLVQACAFLQCIGMALQINVLLGSMLTAMAATTMAAGREQSK